MNFEDFLSENWRHEHPDSLRSQARRAQETKSSGHSHQMASHVTHAPPSVAFLHHGGKSMNDTSLRAVHKDMTKEEHKKHAEHHEAEMHKEHKTNGWTSKAVEHNYARNYHQVHSK